MENFWDFEVWGTFILISVLLASLLIANILRKGIPFLRNSLIPTSVLGGALLLILASIYKGITGDLLFDTAIFAGKGSSTLEVLTYHTLALGFIASALKSSKGKLTKQRSTEIFNTGVTTVSTYLLQGVVGMGLTMFIAAFILKDVFPASGLLLPFGYGQGTGQAMNYGNIYETEHGFIGGKSFGLTIAALGFLSASIGGVIHLNILRHRQKKKGKPISSVLRADEIESENEIPMQESIDKMTIQIALIGVAYLFSFLIMYLLGRLLPGMRSVIYGFNFLLGVISASFVKLLLNLFRRIKAIQNEYTNDFLLTRASNFFFDLMVVAGIAAIRLDILERYWGLMLILGGVGAILTYFYNRLVAAKLFPHYKEEQFLTMYGMLTGTASTAIILLREIDGDFRSPASDNMVYQNFPAIVFGFPLMFLATLAPVKPVLTLIILFLFFLVMNVILFRSFIFKKRKKQ